MTPKEIMIEFCKMSAEMQIICKEPLLENLERFLQTASKEDLDILNKHGDSYSGLTIFSETLALFGAYGCNFYNLN